MTGRSRARDRSRPSGGAPLWTPSQLAPYAWYRGDLGITLVGGKVSAWGDQSGNGAHLTQTTDALRPTYVSSVAARGNCPAVVTGSGLYLEGSITLPREVAFVLALGTVGAGYALSHSIGWTEYHYVYSSTAATYYVRRTSAEWYYRTVSTQPAYTANTNHVAQYDGSSITLRRAGVDVAMGAPVGSPLVAESVTGTLRVGADAGGSNGANLQWCELIICPPLTASQFAALDAYFAHLGRPN